MLSKVRRRLCDLTAGKTRPKKTRLCDARQRFGRRRYDVPSTSAAARPMSDADAPPVAVLSLPVISYASLCEIGAGPIHFNDQAARPGPGENPASKREKPRPWQVRGSRAEALPRFWLIVMLQRNAVCALRATASSLKPIKCDISAKNRSERRQIGNEARTQRDVCSR